MPGELGEALKPSPPSTADRANGQECHRCPNATLILFFFGVDTQGICMRPAHPTVAAMGPETLELLQRPVWPGPGAGQALPAMLPPSKPPSCYPSQQRGQCWQSHTGDKFLFGFFFPLLLPALSGFPLFLPDQADSFPIAIISEARTRPSPLPCRGSRVFSWMI